MMLLPALCATLAADPTIVVAGGGPAGLLSAILLGRRGHAVTVFERGERDGDDVDEASSWSPRSYQIGLNERGRTALSSVGLEGFVRDVSVERNAVVVHDEASDPTEEANPRTVPVVPATLSIGRSVLVRRLTEALLDEGRATIHHGLAVTDVRRTAEIGEGDDDGHLTVCLSDGSTVEATHVVGADGKWSPVRDAAIRLERGRGDDSSGITCTPEVGEAWGIVTAHTLPPGLRTDATHVLRPRTLGDAMYALLAPLRPPSERANLVLVLYDDVLRVHPWLAPRGEGLGTTNNDGASDDSWEDSPSGGEGGDFDDKLSALLRSEFPRTLGSVADAEMVSSRSAASGAYVRRRASWFVLDRFSALDGRIALVGDAAHSMSASLGEGCNTALESAVALAEEVDACADRGGGGDEALSAGFDRYGTRRPAAVHDIQRRSGEASRSKPQETTKKNQVQQQTTG